jgi:dUTP pyrophosphatase
MENNQTNLTVKFLRDAGAYGVSLPSYATDGSAGMDLRASEPVTVEPGEFKSIGTGIHMEIPPGFEGQVRPRSGLALKYGVTLLNSPGTIDSDYRGEIRVIVINHGRKAWSAKPGDRIAQIVFTPVSRVNLSEADELRASDRASGGFGSTGV